MDLKTRLYVAYGFSLKSEKEAFLEAITMLKELGFHVNSFRLDRYFSCETYADLITERIWESYFVYCSKN